MENTKKDTSQQKSANPDIPPFSPKREDSDDSGNSTDKINNSHTREQNR